MSGEEWRAIPGYEGVYEVSDIGRVRSLPRLDAQGRRRKGKLRSPARQKSGHLTMPLSRDRVSRRFLVHHLVLMAFVGPRPPGMFGCHWNDIPDDNRVENLRWDTRSANVLDSVRNGGHPMANKTHCPHGHEYTPENTYIHPSGSRYCNQCRSDYRDAHRQQRREQSREYMRRRRAAKTEKAA